MFVNFNDTPCQCKAKMHPSHFHKRRKGTLISTWVPFFISMVTVSWESFIRNLTSFMVIEIWNCTSFTWNCKKQNVWFRENESQGRRFWLFLRRAGGIGNRLKRRRGRMPRFPLRWEQMLRHGRVSFVSVRNIKHSLMNFPLRENRNASGNT